MAKGVWTECRKTLLTDADKTRLAVVLRGYAAQLRTREQGLAGTISPLSTLQLCVPSALGAIGGQEDAHGLLGMRTYRPFVGKRIVTKQHGIVDRCAHHQPLLRTMTRDLQGAVALDPAVSAYASHSGQFMWKLLLAWAAMGFRTPRIDFVKGRLE